MCLNGYSVNVRLNIVWADFFLVPHVETWKLRVLHISCLLKCRTRSVLGLVGIPQGAKHAARPAEAVSVRGPVPQPQRGCQHLRGDALSQD